MKLLKIGFSLFIMLTVMGSIQAAEWQDGYYTATFEQVDDHGWTPVLEITISDGKITDVIYDDQDKDGAMKSESKAYNKSMMKISKTYPAKFFKKLIKQLKKKQGVPVDGVTGATDATQQMNQLATALLINAEQGISEPVVLIRKMTYTAEEEEKGKLGYIGKISIGYEAGQIVAVTYDERDKKNKSKRDSAYVNTEMKKKNGKISWAEAVIELENQLVEKGDLEQIDSVSGATELSKRFKNLAENAIRKRR